MKKACVDYEVAVEQLAEHFQIENREEVRRLTRVLVGVALKHVHLTVLEEVKDERTSTAIKAEMAQAVCIGTSTIDNYIGQAFKSSRAFQDDKLRTLFSNLFYGNADLSDGYRYLNQSHIGFISGQFRRKHNNELFEGFLSIIAFIESKPLLVNFIKNNTDENDYGFLSKPFMELDYGGFLDHSVAIKESKIPLEFARFSSCQLHQLASHLLENKAILAGVLVFALGAIVPLVVLLNQESSGDGVHFMIHDPGKMMFHLVLFSGALVVFLSKVKIENMITKKSAMLLVLGFLITYYQAYLQDIETHCNENYRLVLEAKAVSCVNLVVLENQKLMGVYQGYSFVLSFLGGAFATLVVFSHIITLINKKSNSNEVVEGQLVANLCFLLWLILRSYSEWHYRTHASGTEFFDADTQRITYYPSFLISIVVVVISQLLILWQSIKLHSISRLAILWIAFGVLVIDGVAIHLAARANLFLFIHKNISDMELLNFYVVCGVLWFCICWILVRGKTELRSD